MVKFSLKAFFHFPKRSESRCFLKNKIPQTAEYESVNESVKKFSLSNSKMSPEEIKIKSILFILRKNKFPIMRILAKI